MGVKVRVWQRGWEHERVEHRWHTLRKRQRYRAGRFKVHL